MYDIKIFPLGNRKIRCQGETELNTNMVSKDS